MTKKLISICMALNSIICVANANGLTPKVEVTKNKFVSIFFPTTIKSYQTGFDPQEFVIKTSEDILILQPMIEFAKETNLMVETDDGSIYIIDIKYVEQVGTTFYKYSTDLAKENRQIKSSRDEDQSSLSSSSKISEKKVENLTHPINDSNLLVVCKLPPHISTNNGCRSKNSEAYLKGVFIKNDFLYFQIQFHNTSNIEYYFDYIGFTIVTKPKRGVSIERTELPLTETYIPQKNLSKGIINIVVKVPKFTLSANKLLLIEIFEGKNGERNISFHIDPSTLHLAKSF